MKIEINAKKEYQTFEGIGASGAWWAQIVGGWDNVDPASNMPTRDIIAQLLYSKDKGIGLRTYRYNIGAGSKHSGKGTFPNQLRRTESFDNNGQLDFTRDKNAVYMMEQAVKNGADEVILFVNSPIERLTKNHMAHCSKSKPFQCNLAKSNYKTFANYCLDVTEYFLSKGIPVKYLSPINEPFWVWNKNQEGCHYSPKQAGEVMQAFAVEMNKRPNLDNVKLSGVENGDVRWFNKSYTNNLLKYKEVRDRIDSVDLHSYFLNPVNLLYFHRADFIKRYRKWLDKKYPNTDVKMSEWCHMQRDRDKSINSALEMAKIMYEDITILNVTSWQHWVAVSEVNYCDGLIYVNLNDKTYEMTKRFYGTGNFSKYIPFGAKRIDVYCEDNDLKLIAFKYQERIILIAINDSSQDKRVELPCNQGKQIVTSESNNLKEYSFDNNSATVTAKSINTFVFSK